ncbi:hypothetical protein BH09SUM1_BH09SUM1_14340 [soil metagenome]
MEPVMAETLNLFDKTKIYLGEVRIEMSKVVWPTQEQVKTYTTVTIISIIAISLLMGAWDAVLGWAVDFIFGITKG